MPYQAAAVPAATTRMMNQQYLEPQDMNQPNMSRQGMMQGQDWSGEITPIRNGNMEMSPAGSTAQPQLQMSHGLPTEVVEAPVDRQEAFLGSLKSTLIRNKGNYIVATFLIGTQNLSSWEGVLYDVGNDYVTIYQPGRDRYVVIDMYSLKYIEFYDTRRQELCDQMLRQRGWENP